MSRKRILEYPSFILLILFISVSCTSTTFDTLYPTLSDGKYDSEFPYRNCSEQLEEIAASLVKLDVLVFYNTYTFTPGSRTDLNMIRNSGGDISELAAAEDVFTETTGGTAISIYYSNDRIAYLSCAHIVDYPDTVISYYPSPDDKYIQLIGIKARQQNSISSHPGGWKMEVLAMDRRSDIVVLGTELSEERQHSVRTFSYPMGSSGELDWGSFVYIMGYPMGHAMITRGIVSDPARIRKGSFLIDAVFNKGFSGGPVIAVRDGVPNFEMVGMVKSSAATNRYYLAPENTDNTSNLNLSEAYKGKLRLVKEKDIKYGITFSVTTKTLRNFFKENQQDFEDAGYFLEGFFE